jgi:hypothetical protein
MKLVAKGLPYDDRIDREKQAFVRQKAANDGKKSKPKSAHSNYSQVTPTGWSPNTQSQW